VKLPVSPVEKTLVDIIAPRLKVLFCGLNPGLGAAIAGHHFHNNSNRFWRVLQLAGFTPELIASTDDRTLLSFGYGLTTVASRATRSAAEVTKDEYRSAGEVLRDKVERYLPAYMAFLGKAAYLTLTSERDVAWGLQELAFAGARVWILPNPSGLNRGFSLDALVDAYTPLRVAANAETPPAH
jgi:TDG/mug DNA glycosylase family protein